MLFCHPFIFSLILISFPSYFLHSIIQNSIKKGPPPAWVGLSYTLMSISSHFSLEGLHRDFKTKFRNGILDMFFFFCDFFFFVWWGSLKEWENKKEQPLSCHGINIEILEVFKKPHKLIFHQSQFFQLWPKTQTHQTSVRNSKAMIMSPNEWYSWYSIEKHA